MKTLTDYYNESTGNKDEFVGGYFPSSGVSIALSKAISLGVSDIAFTKQEMQSFLVVYDQVLPWDWDKKEFRTLKIHEKTT